jgi:hypothetical protein
LRPRSDGRGSFAPLATMGLAAVALVSGCENLKPIGARGSRSTQAGGSAAVEAARVDKPGAVKLELFIMSKCPYGVQAMQAVSPVLRAIGEKVDFRLDYIATDEQGTLKCLHAEPECKGNIQQLCAMKHYPEMNKWLSFIDCQNKTWGNIPDGWEPCADQAGMDKGTLRSCFEGNEGKELAKASAARAVAAKAQGSPTILLAGHPYEGGRGKSDIWKALCDKMTEKAPGCSNIPEDVAVSAIVLTDKRCKQCQTGGLEANLKARFFPKLAVKTVDYGDPDGKKLYKELGIELLPIMVFEKNVEQAEKYSQISRWLLPIKGSAYLQLRIPAQFNPTKEICDNNIDDTEDGKVDCADKDCKDDLICRKEVKNKVDLFIMSQCPYGVQAGDAMKEVVENFKGNLKFDLHFIGDKKGEDFDCMHGKPECNENIRQLCAKKFYGKNNKYLDYVWCRNKDWRSPDFDTTWEKCATAGIAASVIKKCFEGAEGKKLFEESIALAKSLQISASPSWLANNKFKFSALAANDIKTNICQHNKELANCDKTLSGPQAPAAGRGGGGGGSCGN